MGLSRTLIVIAAVALVVVCQPPPQRNGGTVNLACFNALQINRYVDRPASRRTMNIEDQRQTYEYVTLSRHHIIPYATMREFFNNLLRTDLRSFSRLYNNVIVPTIINAGLVPSATVVAGQDYYLPDLDELTYNHLRVRTVDQRMMLQEAYAWLPFNIYIGPQPDDREDDVGNAFDSTARSIVGDLRLESLTRLYGNMRSYIANVVGVSADDIINDMAQLVHLHMLPYEFSPSQWRVRRGTNQYRFAVASDNVVNDREYREIRTDDYCDTDGQAAYDRYHAAGELRKREVPRTVCVLLDRNTDALCINTLNAVHDAVVNGTVTLRGTSQAVLTNDVADPAPLDPKPSLTPSGWFIHLITLGAWP